MSTQGDGVPWEEEWRKIPGFDLYEVSDFGHVRSWNLRGGHKRKRPVSPRTLKLVRSGPLYLGVSLPVGGTYRHHRVHNLVMTTFAGPPPEGAQVAHLNGDPLDNRLVNLAYVTPRENEAHKVAHGTSPVGERNGRARLQGWQVAEIRYLAGKSVPQRKIADLFDLSPDQVGEILSGRSWAHIPARNDGRTRPRSDN